MTIYIYITKQINNYKTNNIYVFIIKIISNQTKRNKRKTRHNIFKHIKHNAQRTQTQYTIMLIIIKSKGNAYNTHTHVQDNHNLRNNNNAHTTNNATQISTTKTHTQINNTSTLNTIYIYIDIHKHITSYISTTQAIYIYIYNP